MCFAINWMLEAKYLVQLGENTLSSSTIMCIYFKAVVHKLYEVVHKLRIHLEVVHIIKLLVHPPMHHTRDGEGPDQDPWTRAHALNQTIDES